MKITFSDVAQIFTGISAALAVLVTWRVSKKIQEIHILINSRLDQLLKVTGIAERAAGAKEQRDATRAAEEKTN